MMEMVKGGLAADEIETIIGNSTCGVCEFSAFEINPGEIAVAVYREATADGRDGVHIEANCSIGDLDDEEKILDVLKEFAYEVARRDVDRSICLRVGL